MTLSDDLTAAAIEAENLEAELVTAKNSLAIATDMIAEKNADIIELTEANAVLQQKLDECEGTEPEPEPEPEPGSRTRVWGMGSFRVLSGNTDPSLDPYRGKTPAQTFKLLDDEFAGLNGGTRMKTIRVYHTSVATDYASTDAAWVPPGVKPVLSLKGDDAQMANGSLDDEITRLINSWPSTVKGYLIWNHERDNDSDALASPSAVMGVHNKALARFAKTVLATRGAKDISPACCPTGWNLQNQNTSYPRDVLNPAADLISAGVPLGEFVYMSDTYYRKAPTAAAVDTIHRPIVARVKGWGFTRVGFGEIGVDTWPNANRIPGGQYLDAWAKMAREENIEVLCWYESGGGDKAPPNGWWIYGSQPKTAWANALKV